MVTAFVQSDGNASAGNYSFGYTLVVDGILYFLGGESGGSALAVNLVQRYEIETNTWLSNGAVIPVLWENGTACLWNNRIYIFGGCSSFSGIQAYNSVYYYNIASNTWTQVTNMTDYKAHHGGTRYGNYYYVFGGNNATGITAGETNTLYRYDFVNDTWATLTADSSAPFQTGKIEQMDCICVNGKIYKFGGRFWNGTVYEFPGVNAMRIYDIATDTWSAGTTGTYQLQNYRCFASGKYIFYFSGYVRLASDGTLYTDKAHHLFVYDTASNSWPIENLALYTLAYASAYIQGRGTYKNRFFIANWFDSTSSNINSTRRSVYFSPNDVMRHGKTIYKQISKELVSSLNDLRINSSGVVEF